MLKRRNPFGDSSPLQYKVHIGAKEVNFGVNQMQNMKTVYDKTRTMLYEGSKSCSSADSTQSSEMCVSKPPSASPLPSGQMTLDMLARLSAQPQPVGGQSSVAMPIATSRQKMVEQTQLPAGQLQISAGGNLTRPVETNGCHGDVATAMLSFKICQLCNRPSNVGARSCNFCDKRMCHSCVQHCQRCGGLFCHLCSVLNYDHFAERAFCLQCTDSR